MISFEFQKYSSEIRAEGALEGLEDQLGDFSSPGRDQGLKASREVGTEGPGPVLRSSPTPPPPLGPPLRAPPPAPHISTHL